MSDEGSVTEEISAKAREFIANLLEYRNSDKCIRPRSLLSEDLGATLVDIPDCDARSYARRVTASLPRGFSCLDFGCGNAPHRKFLGGFGAEWTGCHYAGSLDPATLARSGSNLDGAIVEYDGEVLPFSNNTFDMIWSWQALEHVRNLEVTFAEVHRVLRDGGRFCGSTSFLEPYHAQSTFSFTLFGFKTICERNGLKLLEIAPSLDGFSYLVKRLALVLNLTSDGARLQSQLESARPLDAIRLQLEGEGRSGEWVHLLAQICGTFRFCAEKI